jgi:hypothetical protein
MKMARLAPRHRTRQLDVEDDDEDELLFRSQTWLGAGDPDAPPLPLDGLGLGLAAKALLTPKIPSTEMRTAPASTPRVPIRRRGRGGGGAFIAPKNRSIGLSLCCG